MPIAAEHAASGKARPWVTVLIVTVLLLLLGLVVAGGLWLSASAPMIVLDANEPLTQAVAAGDRAKVSALLGQGYDVDTRTLDGRTPLILAALQGDAALVELLLRSGADIHATGDDGRTALQWAETYRRGAVIRLLREAGAGPQGTTH